MNPDGRAAGQPTDRRRAVLSTLQESSNPLAIQQIARQLDVHPNTVRFHLDALIADGRVERVAAPPSGPGRPPQKFRALPGMDPSGPRNYRLLAGILADNLAHSPQPARAAADAGRAWGRQLVGSHRPANRPAGRQPVNRLVTILDELGFAPERRPGCDGTTIGLRHCPFLELAQTQDQVVCQIHLGLMQGAMTEMRSGVQVQQLDRFVEPGLCLAHLVGRE